MAAKPCSDGAALQAFARNFDCAELHHTHWEFPRAATLAQWVRRVEANPAFRFNPLLHRVFTHQRSLDTVLVERFCEGLRPLVKAQRLGCLVMQFPWVFKFTDENKQAFLTLRRAFGEFPLVAEFRHSSWQFPEAQGVLIDHKVGYVNVDLPHHIRAAGPSAELTSPIGYFRLHGHHRALWRNEWEHHETRFRKEEYEYSVLQLVQWQSRIERIAPFADRCFVALANDAQAASARNALALRGLMGDQRVESPDLLLAARADGLSGDPIQPASAWARRPTQRTLLPMRALAKWAQSA
jgi:uncharacterized protein YecE (DUF72 family)